MINGILNVHKEAGYTSHDVVAKLRGILKQKKIGHTGTLDPDATGVLPVCLGKATKLCDMLTDKSKTYEAILLLGTITDTEDSSGTVLEQQEVNFGKEEIEKVILSFVGEYEQVPPMYSALKVNGKKLYELAREGKVIERKARPVTIHDITIKEYDLEHQRVRMTVSCSKGTYIRTLCHDIGQKLGCGACMDRLIRTKVSRFLLEDSVTLGEIEQLRDQGKLDAYIVPIDEMFAAYEAIHVKEENCKLVYNGNAFRIEHLQESDSLEGTMFRVYDFNDTFVGIYERKNSEEFKPVKMFL